MIMVGNTMRMRFGGKWKPNNTIPIQIQFHNFILINTRRNRITSVPFRQNSTNACVSNGVVSGNNSLDLSGIFPPIPTPFKPSGPLDLEKLRSNFATWNKIPFAGYVIMGSNGEAVSLRTQEKLELLKNARELSKTSSKIIAGLGMHTVDETVELCNAVAEERTADAALIITPSFYKGQMTNKTLQEYYEDVADKSKLPILLYSVPGNTGIDLLPEVAVALSKHPNCIGIKDSGGDITKIAQIIHQTSGSPFQVIAGSAGFLLPALVMGCVGGICALANVLGSQVCELYKLFRQGRIGEAVILQRKLIVPNAVVTRGLGVPGLKAALDASEGLYGGPCRPPLLPLESKELTSLKAKFAENYFRLN